MIRDGIIVWIGGRIRFSPFLGHIRYSILGVIPCRCCSILMCFGTAGGLIFIVIILLLLHFLLLFDPLFLSKCIVKGPTAVLLFFQSHLASTHQLDFVKEESNQSSLFQYDWPPRMTSPTPPTQKRFFSHALVIHKIERKIESTERPCSEWLLCGLFAEVRSANRHVVARFTDRSICCLLYTSPSPRD